MTAHVWASRCERCREASARFACERCSQQLCGQCTDPHRHDCSETASPRGGPRGAKAAIGAFWRDLREEFPGEPAVDLFAEARLAVTTIPCECGHALEIHGDLDRACFAGGCDACSGTSNEPRLLEQIRATRRDVE